MSDIDTKLKTLRDSLKSTGVRCFSDQSWNTVRNAERNLDGITHYVDPSTRRYFHARVTYSGDHFHELIFAIVESVALDPNNTKRGFRYVLFDVFGSTIDRPGFDACVSSGSAAKKRMYAALDALDVPAHYSQVLQERGARLHREAVDMVTMAREVMA
jgi:hypothetical protein